VALVVATGAANASRPTNHQANNTPPKPTPACNHEAAAYCLPLYEAALRLAETFHLQLQPNREEATRNPKPTNS